MTANQVALAYLVASVFFILALKGLSSPESARRGNLFGMVGMALAVLTTLAIVLSGQLEFIFVAMQRGAPGSKTRDEFPTSPCYRSRSFFPDFRHSRVGGNLELQVDWVPAFARTTHAAVPSRP